MQRFNLFLTTVFFTVSALFIKTSYAQQTGSFDTQINFAGNPNWDVSCYVPPSYNPANKYKLIICLHGLDPNEPSAAQDMRTLFVSSSYWGYTSDTLGLVTNPKSSVYNAIVMCPCLYGTNTDLWEPVSDTALITKLISVAMSTYNIDPHYIYLSGFSLGARGALRYGLLNYWRFRGLELWTPAIQSMNEANNRTSFTYPYQNGKYIPIYISVGEGDATFPPMVTEAFDELFKLDALSTLQIVYGMAHYPPPNSNTFFGFNYIDSHATSYAMNDAGIYEISSPAEQICSTTFTPVVSIQNKGKNNLTSATVNYQIDNGTVGSYSWSGNLIQLGVSKITLPAQTVSIGAHVIKVYTSMPNGVTDTVPSNDTLTESFSSITNGLTSITEGFEGSQYPPAGWSLSGSDSAWNWLKLTPGVAQFSVLSPWQSGANGLSTSCIYFDNSMPYKFYNTSSYNNILGKKRFSIRTPILDFTNSSNPTVQYDYAYAPYDSVFSDTLAVYYSADCGNTWDTLLVKGGTDLSTSGYDNTSLFIPGSTHWQHQIIDLNLPSIVGKPEVMFSFENRSGHGNAMYLDNISISAVTGIATQKQENDFLNIYPNPTANNATLDFSLEKNENVTIEVINLLGEEVCLLNEGNLSAGNHHIAIDGSKLQPGVYFIKFDGGNNTTITKKLIIQR